MLVPVTLPLFCALQVRLSILKPAGALVSCHVAVPLSFEMTRYCPFAKDVCVPLAPVKSPSVESVTIASGLIDLDICWLSVALSSLAIPKMSLLNAPAAAASQTTLPCAST